MISILLAIIGLILILLEFYLPGAVMAILGSVLLIMSLVLFASAGHPLWVTAFFVSALILGIIGVIRFALWRIVKAKPGYSIYLHKDQEGYQASSYDHSAIGKVGVVLSDLKPGGYILIEGKQHQAISNSGYLTKGAEVLVVSGQEESLIVKSVKNKDVHS